MGVMAMVVMIQRFYKNVLGDEGYLTLTLPVNVHEILWSKLIVSFVWFLATGLIAIAAVFVAVFTLTYSELGEMFRNMPSFGEMLRLFFEKTDITPWQLTGAVAQFAAMIILSSLTACLHFYAAMALGHSFSNHKILLSVVFYIGFGIVTQTIGTIFASVGIQIDISPDFWSSLPVTQVFSSLAWAAAGVSALLGAAYYVLTLLMLKKRLNLQ